MYLGGIHLPEPLLRAQREGTLVIFAGAGVSMPPPSGHPNFKQLADRLAQETGIPPEENEPIDRFLGRLQKQGIPVHRLTARIFQAPASRPNSLHHDLLRLFPGLACLRLVTTNVDGHFTTAAKETLPGPAENYYAPALPLGHRFSGLVYLHGCCCPSRREEEMVLSDSDFGRAYLTEGWARRFLQEMFARFTVLFVGYSHNDLVLTYLARGLSPEPDVSPRHRYAFTSPDKESHWKYLGIDPICYQLSPGPDEHTGLRAAVSAWVHWAGMGALDHEHRLRDLVFAPPPLEPEVLDYLATALRETETVRVFTRHARSLEWLRWVAQQGALAPLFAPEQPIPPVALELSSWLAQVFLPTHPAEVLALVQRQGANLHPVLWKAFAHQLVFGAHRPDSRLLSQWLLLLLRHAHPSYPTGILAHFLYDCSFPFDVIPALQLWERLTAPRLEMIPGSPSPATSPSALDEEETPEGGVELSLAADPTVLQQAWKELFLPHLELLADRLEPIVIGHLEQACLLLQACDRLNAYEDWLSFRRPAVEDLSRPPVAARDLLVDTVRDLLEGFLAHNPEHGRHLVDRWIDSRLNIFRRLAVHGQVRDPARTPAAKLEWLLAHQGLFVPELRHEVFALLRQAYPAAPEEARQALLARAVLGPQERQAEALSEGARRYRTYNLLYCLHESDPSCRLATAAFAEAQRASPEFRPSAHPDRAAWISSSEERRRSPMTVDKLVIGDLAGLLPWMLGYSREEHHRPDRDELLHTVTDAVAQSFAWGQRLAQALIMGKEWTTALWPRILLGWQRDLLSEEEWREVLILLDRQPDLLKFSAPLAELLETGSRREAGGLPPACLDLAEKVARRLWASLLRDPAPSFRAGEWLQKSARHPAGKLASFWLHDLARRQAAGETGKMGPAGRTLPPAMREGLEEILSATEPAALPAQAVLASRVHFLHDLDPVWTGRRIIPLFSWETPERARLSWQEFLVRGRWNEESLSDLLPCYVAAFPRVSQELSEVKDAFCRHLADIAVYHLGHPLRDGWLPAFLNTVPPDLSRIFTSYLTYHLQSLKEEAAGRLWETWLEDYWEYRLTGHPSPLDDDERIRMLFWLVHLGPAFPRAVDKVCRSPGLTLHHPTFFRRLLEKGYARHYPAETARLLNHLLAQAPHPLPSSTPVAELFQELRTNAPATEDLIRLERYFSRPRPAET